MPLPNPLVVVYLAAIIAANLLVSRFGPAVTTLHAFLLIGLDLVARDHLHDAWPERTRWLRMLALISVGGLLSLLLGGLGRIALASCGAFVLAGVADTAGYHLLQRQPRWTRINGSNLVAAAVDSLLFPLLAFGWPLLWGTVIGQFVAKVGGGALFTLLLATHIGASADKTRGK